MANSTNMLQLCRLCLVKDDVNIPIFEEQGDIRQIFLKISSCLPVKVSREDRLPKKICDGCSYKLDMLYEFWNTSANAEKQLLSWLGEAGVSSKMADGAISAMAQQMKPTEAFVKEETLEPADLHAAADEDEKEYLFEQQKVEESASAGPSATVTSNEEDEPPPKRARRTAAVKAAIAMDQDSDDDDDSGEPLTKVEDESEDSDGEDHVPAFVDVPSTSADDQPGPSGVGKDGVEAPSNIRTNVKRGKNQCSECSKSFKNIHHLRSHLLTHDDKFPYKCPQCEKRCKRKQELKTHSKIHDTNRDTFTCEVCQKKLTSKTSLIIHHKRHQKLYTVFCEYCKKGFYTKTSLTLHTNSKHEGKSSFVCEICGRQCYDRTSLENHRMKHDANYGKMKNIECTICNTKFIDEKYLGVHMYKKHTGDYSHRFICEHCGKKLSSKNSLQEHMVAVHEGLKPHKCEICNQGFANRTTLILHSRRHTGIRPYKCSVCTRDFTQSHSLKVHMRLHTGEKPEACTICEQSFISKSMLRSHLKQKHKIYEGDIITIKSENVD